MPRRSSLGLLLAFVIIVSTWENCRAQSGALTLPIEIVPNRPSLTLTVRFSPDGTRAISGGTDGSVKLWDVATGRLLRTLLGHAKGV
jgi:WD40 repeat protein